MTIRSQENSVIDQEQIMKSIRRIICFVMALVCLSLSLVSCGDKMIMTGAGLTHKKTGVNYAYVLDPCYQPKEYETDAYTKWKYNDFTVEYYAIKGFEPTEWLYCPVLGELLCATGEELPDLNGFAPNSAFICIEAAVPYSIYEIKDQATVDMILQRLTDPETPSYSTIMYSSNYTLKFVSEKYPAFYYSVVLVADEDGVYVHDRMNGRYIDMGLLFNEYDLYNTDDEP